MPSKLRLYGIEFMCGVGGLLHKVGCAFCTIIRVIFGQLNVSNCDFRGAWYSKLLTYFTSS